jgi:hypothetical protein
MGKTLFLSRPRAQADWQCPRLYYYSYHYDGKGIRVEETSLELMLGEAVHAGLSAIALQHRAGGVDLELIAAQTYRAIFDTLAPLNNAATDYEGEEFCREQATLGEGLIRGFYRSVWPGLIAEYPKVLLVEDDLTLTYQDTKVPVKPDLVLADDEGPVYIEYKTTKNKREDWITQWNSAIQVHATAYAIEEKLGEPVSRVIVQGLYKGYESWGKQSSPFCYAYRRQGTPPFSKDEVSYTYKQGFQKYPVWALEGGIKEWIARMPGNILSDQFPQTPPIFPNRGLIDRWLAQRFWREKEVKLASEMLLAVDDESKQGILDITFPQKFDACHPAWGGECTYRRLCFGEVTEPLKHGFTYRKPGHSAERLAVEEEEKEQNG